MRAYRIDKARCKPSTVILKSNPRVSVETMKNPKTYRVCRHGLRTRSKRAERKSKFYLQLQNFSPKKDDIRLISPVKRAIKIVPPSE